MSIEHDSSPRLHSSGVLCRVLLGKKFIDVVIVVCYERVGSLSHSLSTRLIPLGLRSTGFRHFYTPSAPPGLLEAGAQRATYKLFTCLR